MLIKDYDRIVVLVVDHRYHTEVPRIQKLIASKGGREVVPFVDGDGHILPRHLYGQISPRPPIGWNGPDKTYSQLIAIRTILQQAKRDGVQNLLFLEDDVDFTPEFDEVVSKATEQLSAKLPGICMMDQWTEKDEEIIPLPDWDMLYYGANHTWHRTDQLKENVLGLNGSYCLHCVGIRRRMFDPLLSLPDERVMDWMISNYIHHQYNCYAIWPSIAIQKPGFSYLNGKHEDYSEWFKSKGANH
jgi:hypothetical protein